MGGWWGGEERMGLSKGMEERDDVEVVVCVEMIGENVVEGGGVGSVGEDGIVEYVWRRGGVGERWGGLGMFVDLIGMEDKLLEDLNMGSEGDLEFRFEDGFDLVYGELGWGDGEGVDYRGNGGNEKEGGGCFVKG